MNSEWTNSETIFGTQPHCSSRHSRLVFAVLLFMSKTSFATTTLFSKHIFTSHQTAFSFILNRKVHSFPYVNALVRIGSSHIRKTEIKSLFYSSKRESLLFFWSNPSCSRINLPLKAGIFFDSMCDGDVSETSCLKVNKQKTKNAHLTIKLPTARQNSSSVFFPRANSSSKNVIVLFLASSFRFPLVTTSPFSN